MARAAPVTVRDARPDERAAIHALTTRAYGEYATIMAPAAWAGLDAAVRAALDTGLPAHRLVAERGGRLVGSVMLFPPASDAYAGLTGASSLPELRLLAVAPEGRRLGVGEALVAACIRRARDQGAPAIALHTSASMRAAMRLYERLGFVRAPELDFQPPGAERVEGYRLVLDQSGAAARQ
jgi:ribosomal protein S18 acetylase RimI-like enzyme